MERRFAVPLCVIVGLIVFFGPTTRLTAAQSPQPGTIVTVAGNGHAGHSGDGGPATQAAISDPFGLTFDAAGNLFIACLDSAVRRVDPSGIITRVAGSGEMEFSGDGGPATSAGMNPFDVAADSAGNLYIADGFNRRVRKVDAGGIITTFAGGGDPADGIGDGGPATSARLGPLATAVATDTKGNLFIDTGGHIRMVTPAGTITTVAGKGERGSSGDGGPAVAAQAAAWDVAVDDAGRVYIAEYDYGRVRMVAPDGTIHTIAGGGHPADGVGDGGLATDARLETPAQIALDGAGNLYITDTHARRIRRVGPLGIISTVVGTGKAGFSPDGTLATQARLTGPQGLAIDKDGNLFYSEVNADFSPAENGRIRKVVGIAVPR